MACCLMQTGASGELAEVPCCACHPGARRVRTLGGRIGTASECALSATRTSRYQRYALTGLPVIGRSALSGGTSESAFSGCTIAAGRRYGAGGEDVATSSLQITDGVPRCPKHLDGANLQLATLTGAYLDGATRQWATLTGAHLDGANVNGADLAGAILIGADFSGAMLHWTIFAKLDLTDTKGLNSCKHDGPSPIDFLTLSTSINLPLSLLRGCGLPDNVIEYLSSLHIEAIQFYSCFISYSRNDQLFAERLHADLQNKGVRCWFAPHDLPIGAKTWDAIDQPIRLRDKLLLILSKSSIASEWVEDEVNKVLCGRAIQEERCAFSDPHR
jgi:hypothetical protein